MRLPISLRRPHSRIMPKYFGVSIEVRQKGVALVNRTIELINFDRRAAAQPEAGQVFRR